MKENMDILDGIAQIHAAFRASGLESPTVILLKSNEEGMRFLGAIRQKAHYLTFAGSPDLGKPIEMADGSVWMECKVMDIAVRWPANRWANPDGSWSYV